MWSVRQERHTQPTGEVGGSHLLGSARVSAIQRTRLSASIRHLLPCAGVWTELEEQQWAEPDVRQPGAEGCPRRSRDRETQDGDCKGCWTRVAQLCTLQLEVPQCVP